MDSLTDRQFGYATDIGRGSSHNQDRLGFYLPDDPSLADLAGSIFVVADGMGSRERGASLADQAIRTLVRAYYRGVREHGRAGALARAITAADETLRHDLAAKPDTEDSGVALVATVVRGEELLVARVGSVRAYLVREGQAYRLTDDGPGTAAQLGRGSLPQTTISEGIPLGPGDRVLLCSDGLYQLVDDDQIGTVVGSHVPQEATDRLIALANARGGWDNITALVVAPFATSIRPVTSPGAASDDISWRAVTVGAGTIIFAAALVLFRPWEYLAPPGQWVNAAGLLGIGQEATAEPPLPPATVAAAGPTATATLRPSPTIAATPTSAIITMPSLIGESADNARQAIRALGLTLDEISQWSPNVAPEFVTSQSPVEGTELEPGATVQIAVSLGPAPPPSPRPLPTLAPTAAASPTAPPLPTQPPAPTEEKKKEPEQPAPTFAPPTAEPTKPEPPTLKPPAPTVAAEPTAAPPASNLVPARRVRGLAAPLRDAQPAEHGDGGGSAWARLRRLLAALLGLPGRIPAAASDSAPRTASGPINDQVTTTATVSPTGTITITATFTPTLTSTPTDTPTPTNTPTSTPTPTATFTPTPTPTPTPKPAYLPGLYRDQWLLCDKQWPGIDDPEPNDDPRRPPAGVDLCPGRLYGGRLWHSGGPTDEQDWYTFTLRRPGGARVSLDVPEAPRTSSIDYDMWLFFEVNGKPNGLEIQFSRAGAGEDELIERSGLPAGRYWIRIWGMGRQIQEPYWLTWDYLYPDEGPALLTEE